MLTESLSICHYLESCQPEPNLLGHDAKEKALVLMWHDILTLEGYIAIQEVLRNSSDAFKGRPLPGTVAYEQIPALAERGRRRAEVFFDRLDSRLGESKFVASNRYTYADIVGYVLTGFAWRALKTHPIDTRAKLRAWYEEIAERPAIARLVSD